MESDKSHVFISYSRVNKDFVEKLVDDLQQNQIPVWVDTVGLSPGTPNWEQAIRDAIEQSFAVLLVASPDSRQSVYVQGELSVAKIRNCPVYPVWADGENWIDCIQLGMVNSQYVDCRAERYSAGIQQIVAVMSKFVDSHKDEILLSISLPTHETVKLVPTEFENIQGLLNYVFMNYLIDWYQPLTYGSDWVLANVRTRQLAVPWEWLFSPTGEKQPLYLVDRNWGTANTRSFGIVSNTHWAIWEASRIKGVGFATNKPELERRLLSPFGSRDLMLLLSSQCLKPVKAHEVDRSRYAINKIFTVFGTTYKDVAFVETDKDCTELLT